MKKTYVGIAIIIVIVVLGSVAVYLVNHRSVGTTADTIFTEVSTQFGFTREQVGYFDIFSDDRVQYNLGNGVTFAYKDGGIWHISGPTSSQEVPECSLLAAVPEQYRQACYDKTSGKNLYVDENMQNLNYPISERVVYIGQ